MTMPDYPDFVGARVGTIAAQPVARTVADTLAPGQSTQARTYELAQLGYDLQFHATAAAGGNGPDFATMLLQWVDPTTGIVVFQKARTIAAGPPGSPHRITASGPARAAQLQVTVTALAANPDTVSTQFTVLQTSRAYTQEQARTKSTADANFAGITPGGYVIESGNLLNTSPNAVGAGGSVTRALAFWEGQVFIKAHTFSGAADLSVSVNDATGLQSFDAPVFHGVSDAAGYLNASLFLPSLQCELVLTNGNAAAQTLAASVTAAQTDV